mgnify:CR=1 FL=1
MVHNGTAYFVEVPESGTDITSQSQAVFAQAERTLALAGSNKAQLLIATIYLKHMGDRAAFNARNDAAKIEALRALLRGQPVAASAAAFGPSRTTTFRKCSAA